VYAVYRLLGIERGENREVRDAQSTPLRGACSWCRRERLCYASISIILSLTSLSFAPVLFHQLLALFFSLPSFLPSIIFLSFLFTFLTAESSVVLSLVARDTSYSSVSSNFGTFFGKLSNN
jgi:hypothetical protein